MRTVDVAFLGKSRLESGGLARRASQAPRVFGTLSSNSSDATSLKRKRMSTHRQERADRAERLACFLGKSTAQWLTTGNHGEDLASTSARLVCAMYATRVQPSKVLRSISN